jgi:hypothetical protein
MLTCRMARGFAAPDSVMMGVLPPRVKSPAIFEKGSGPSQRIGWSDRNWWMSKGVERRRGVLTMKPRRRPGRRKDMFGLEMRD